MATSFDLQVDRDSELPIGTQLAWKIRALISEGALAPGARLPSVRELAERAGVNVNTARAVYGRLEDQGVLSSEQGRGTFLRRDPGASDPEAVDPHERAVSDAGRPARAGLRHQIERLEAELARHPQLSEQQQTSASPGGTAGVLTTEELREIRDSLLNRLREIEDARAEVIRTLERLDQAQSGESPPPAHAAPESSASSTSLGGMRVRWVGSA